MNDVTNSADAELAGAVTDNTAPAVSETVLMVYQNYLTHY
jgi:hypothetical protein